MSNMVDVVSCKNRQRLSDVNYGLCMDSSNLETTLVRLFQVRKWKTQSLLFQKQGLFDDQIWKRYLKNELCQLKKILVLLLLISQMLYLDMKSL